MSGLSRSRTAPLALSCFIGPYAFNLIRPAPPTSFPSHTSGNHGALSHGRPLWIAQLRRHIWRCRRHRIRILDLTASAPPPLSDYPLVRSLTFRLFTPTCFSPSILPSSTPLSIHRPSRYQKRGIPCLPAVASGSLTASGSEESRAAPNRYLHQSFCSDPSPAEHPVCLPLPSQTFKI